MTRCPTPWAKADPEEILLFWAQPTGSSHTLKGKAYYHVAAPPGGPESSRFDPYPTAEFGLDFSSPGADVTVSERGAYDVLMADLDGDGRVDPLTLWLARDNTLKLEISSVTTNFTFQRRSVHDLPQVIRDAPAVPSIVRVIQMRSDPGTAPRICVAWLDPEGRVNLEIAELREGLQIYEVLARRSLERAVAAEDSGRFDIAAGDFNGDGNQEVAVLTTEDVTVPNGLQNWLLRARFFTFLPDTPPFFFADSIPSEEGVLYFKDGRSFISLERVAGHANDFDGDGRDELAVLYEAASNGDTTRWYLQFLKPDVAMNSLAIVPDVPQQFDQTNGSSGYPIDLQSGEFDGDPLPELVAGWRLVRVLDVRADLTTSGLAEASGVSPQSGSDSRRYITLANLDNSDPNYGYRPEVVVATDHLINGNSQQRFTIQSFTVTGDASASFRMDQEAVVQDEIGSNPPRFMAIGAADFGGNGPKLGVPRRYTRTISGRPIVIVNSPPIHFDVLNGTAYDVNNMFPTLDCLGSECGFFSRYTVQETESIEVSTDWERGWNVGTKVEGGVELPLDIGLKAEIETKFGERFNNFASSNTTTVVEVQVDAVAEDRIYAATVSYTVWEYPVLLNEEIVTYIVAYAPDVTRQNWFGSKSIVAQNYRPYHEVGNLLSYRSATEPYPGAEYVREVESADTFTVDSSSAYQWRLTRTSTATTTESRSFSFSAQATASFDIPIPFIPDLELTGGYDTTSLDSSTTALTDSQGLRAVLGALDGSIAGTAYSITPYFYWDRSGALVLDYAVDLSSGTAGVPTFWGQRYGAKSDPAFILPWRLDPEKGLALVDESQRQLTREIAAIPPDPRPGEQVDLVARISNFSFLDTPNSFRVRFYLGDPTNGGQLLRSTDGHDSVLAPNRIPARGKHLVHFPWKVPELIATSSIAIYCVIDSENQIDETHENNNVGWNEISLRQEP